VQWTAALRDNAKLHLLVASAEYCGIIEPPDLSIWNVMEERFKFSQALWRENDTENECRVVTVFS